MTRFNKFEYLKSLRRAGIPPGPCLTLRTIADYADANGGNARPTEQTLADDVGVSVRTIQNHIRWLMNHGWLAQESRGTRGRASVYSLTYGTAQKASEAAGGAAHPEPFRVFKSAAGERTQPETEQRSTSAPTCTLCGKPVTNDVYKSYKGTWHFSCLRHKYPDVDWGIETSQPEGAVT